MQPDNISIKDKLLFKKLVETKGFEYALSNFLLQIFDWEKNMFEISSMLETEVNRISTLSVDEYNARDFAREIRYLSTSEKVPSLFKTRLMYQIISKTIDNNNLKNISEKIVIRILRSLFSIFKEFPYDELAVLIMIYRDKVLYEQDLNKQNIMNKAFVTIMANRGNLDSREIIPRFLGIAIVLIFGFVYQDEIVDSQYRDNFKDLLYKNYKIDLTKQKESFVSIIKNNERLITESFPYNEGDLIIDSFNMSYTPEKLVVVKRNLADFISVSDLRFAQAFLSSKFEFKLEDFLKIDEEDKYHQKKYIEQFTSRFKIDTNENFVLKEKTKIILEKYTNLFKVPYKDNTIFLKEIFEEANRKLFKLKDIVLYENVNEKITSLLNYRETDVGESYEVLIDNLKIFGSQIALETNKEDLLQVNFGINDKLELTDEVLAGLIMHEPLSLALEILFKKHLKKIEIADSDDVFSDIEKVIKDNNVDKYNESTILYKRYNFEDQNQYKKTHKNLTQERRSIVGMPNVYINNNNFQFKIYSGFFKRTILTDDEVSQLLAEKYRISSGLFKIGEIYLNYEKAFSFIKESFRKDMCTFKYMINVKDNPGFYIIFT